MKIYRIAGSVIVYHGSSEEVLKFDPRKQQSGYYPGFYVTDERSIAEGRGAFIHSYGLNNEKFYEINNGQDAEKLKEEAKSHGYSVSMGSGNGEARYLKSIGYEGIKRGREYIVFEPEKSLVKV